MFIQQAFNGMVAIMMAKFILNDAPHALYGKGGREVTPSDLYSKIAGSLVKSEQLIEEAWADGSMSRVIEFHGFKLERDVERQIVFLQSFLNAMRRGQLGQ